MAVSLYVSARSQQPPFILSYPNICKRKPLQFKHIYDSYNPTMKIEKYVFHYGKANDLYSRKHGSPRPLNHCETFVLHAIRYLNTARIATILDHASRCHYQVSYVYVKRSVDFLISIQFVQRNDLVYFLTYKAREYLSGIRRYLLNKRL